MFSLFQCMTPNDTLKTHITGVISHGHPQPGGKIFKFLDLNQYPHDSNLTINCLLRVLHDLSKKVDRY